MYNDKLKKLREKSNLTQKEFARKLNVRTRLIKSIENNEFDLTQKTYEKLVSLMGNRENNLVTFDKPQVITFSVHKGGTGKSSTVINMAMELANRGYEVLVIDTDSQMDTTFNLLSTDVTIENKNFFTAITTADDLRKYVIETDYDNIDIVPSTIDSLKIEKALSMIPTPDRLFGISMRGIMEDNNYDFVLVDCNNQLGLLADSLWMATDYLLTICEPSMFNLKGCNVIINQYNFMNRINPNLKYLGVLFNKIHKGREINKLCIEEMDEVYPGVRFDSYVSIDEGINKAQWAGVPLMCFDKHSRAIRDYERVVDEMINKMKGDC